MLEDYSDADLNPSPSGGHQEEEDPRQRGGAQQVQCQQQWWSLYCLYIWSYFPNTVTVVKLLIKVSMKKKSQIRKLTV